MIVLEHKFEIGDIVYYYTSWAGFRKMKIVGIRLSIEGEKRKTEYKLRSQSDDILSSMLGDNWNTEDEVFASREDFIESINKAEFPD